MGQAIPFKPIALVVEDDIFQREGVAALLEESEMGVIQCETAEEALRVLEKIGECVSLMFTDVELGGQIDGMELAHFSAQRYPNIHMIVSDRDLGPCTNEKAAGRCEVHAEAMASARHTAQAASAGERFEPVVAKPRNLPARMCSSEDATWPLP